MLLGKLSKLESRRYSSNEQYRFLVHTVLDDPEGAFNYLSGSQPSGFRLESGKPLNCSLIDQVHTATFEGAAGFIIQPTEKIADIIGVWSSDVAIDMQTKNRVTMTGDALLSATNQGEYNQIHLKAGKIVGIFIRVIADTGEELGFPNTNKSLRKLAAQQDLPVVEIAVSPRRIIEAEPFIQSLDSGNSRLYQIILPHNGYEYKIDVVKKFKGQDISFVDAKGFAMRVAKIDCYDVWDRNLTTDDFTFILKHLALIHPANPEIAQYVERQITKLLNRGDAA